MTLALRITLRTIIAGTYVLGLLPWLGFAITGRGGFAILGLAFGTVLAVLWPTAKRDWRA